MAVSTSTVWEVRSTGTAGNLNGGGFVTGASGTDYSQQDTAQYTATDLVVDAVDNTKVTSATHPGVAAMVGNIMHVTAGIGYTAGWYEITAVASGVITLDRSPAAVGVTGGTFYIGGAISLGATGAGIGDDAFFETFTNTNKCWIKSGSYTPTIIAISAAGGAQAPKLIEGYASTRGDKPTGSTRPSLDTAAQGITLAANWNMSHVIVTGTIDPVLMLGSGGQLSYCKVSNTSASANRFTLQCGTDPFVFACELVSYRGYAVYFTSGGTLQGCYVHDSNVGYISDNAAAKEFLLNNIFSGNRTTAVWINSAKTGQTVITGNTIYGSESKLGIGVDLVTGTTDVLITNNIIYGLVTGVKHADTQTVGYDNFNSFNNNTANTSNWTLGASSVTTAPGFTSVAETTGATATTSGGILTQAGANFASVTANQDFCLITAGTGVTTGQHLITAKTATTLTLSPAPSDDATADKVFRVTTGRDFGIGANLKELGSPGVFPGGLSTGYMDIGAVQRQDSAGFTNPGTGSVAEGTTYTFDDTTFVGTFAISKIPDQAPTFWN